MKGIRFSYEEEMPFPTINQSEPAVLGHLIFRSISMRLRGCGLVDLECAAKHIRVQAYTTSDGSSRSPKDSISPKSL